MLLDAFRKVWAWFTLLIRQTTLKACVCYFLSNFYFSPNDNPSKAMKNVFLFHLKSSFRTWDIQIFVLLSSPLFYPVSHCSRGWSKKNLKTYGVINCLSKNLITHFVWYLKKEIRCDTETLSIDRELNKEHFYGKIMQKMCTKSWPKNPFKFCWITQNSHCMQESLFKKSLFWMRIIKKP